MYPTPLLSCPNTHLETSNSHFVINKIETHQNTNDSYNSEVPHRNYNQVNLGNYMKIVSFAKSVRDRAKNKTTSLYILFS